MNFQRPVLSLLVLLGVSAGLEQIQSTCSAAKIVQCAVFLRKTVLGGINSLYGNSEFAIAAQSSSARLATEHKRLEDDETIAGLPCAKGDAWFYASGKLANCALAADAPFGELQLPKGSHVTLTEDGSPKFAQPSRNLAVHGLACMGGGLLGPSEGPTIAFYPNGRFKLCFLAKDQQVEGVPCARGGFWQATRGHDAPVTFTSQGGFHSCGLARGYQGHKKGDLYTRPLQ